MRVLIADDEDLLLELLERSLKLDKYVVDTAKDGKEALEKSMNNNYDVILADVIMPEMNGLQVCRELRRNNIHTPIIMLTSKSGEPACIAGLDAGADDYVTKPFRYHELEARIRAVARRPKKVEAEQIIVGPLALDQIKKVISLHGEPIVLRPKEFALLEYLIRNANQVISKEDLLQNVWRISATNASNRLEVCMYHIRTKVNADKQILKTVRGYGYLLEPQK